jgi:hypothetical protein
LAEELLGDIELGTLDPMAIARKTSRLARLMNDEAAMRWLEYEVRGYPMTADNKFPPEAWWAALESNRPQWDQSQESWAAPSITLGQAQATLDAAQASLTAAADASMSLSSANPSQYVAGGRSNANERLGIHMQLQTNRGLIDRAVGSFHKYTTQVYRQLRFGAAVESAFETVRARVDAAIESVIPDGLPKLTAAFENAASDNPEHWAGAAATCRRLLKSAADRLQPAGPDVDDRKMGDGNYINRLVYWIELHQVSDTAAAMVVTDLRYLGERLDACDDAGHKGAHAEVDRFDAARFITGTYLLLGDILRLYRPSLEEEAQVGQGTADGVGVAPETTSPNGGA